MTFFIVACAKRRSTRTTTVLACLSLTTMPWSVRFGISNPLLLLRLRLGGSLGFRLGRGLACGGLGLLRFRRSLRGRRGALRPRRRFRHARALLRGNGLEPGDVATDHAHARGILELTGSALEAQVELLLLELEHFVVDLIERHRSYVYGFHGLTRRCVR